MAFDSFPNACRRSSNRSFTTRSSADFESYYRASAWNPICSVQSSGSNLSTEEFEEIELEIQEDELVENEVAVDRPEDPPEVNEAIHALVPWDDAAANDNEKNDLKKNVKAEDGSSTTDELSDPPSDESDIEPCEEHYRIPPAKDEGEIMAQEIICRADPPDITVYNFKNDLLRQINTQLALVEPPTSKCNGYKHHFITVEEQHRFLLLYNFLKRNLSSKIIIYFSTTKSTQYHARLLDQLEFDVEVVHNGLSKEKFLDTYLAFSERKCGVLCIPDSQGSEFTIPPSVSWIVQYEPPQDPTEYIFRVGRISCEHQTSREGKALLFLTPHQFNILSYFKSANIKIYEYEMHKLSNVQRRYERLVRRDVKLNKLGKEAYHSYLLAYASHKYRDVYDIHSMEKNMVARSFGFDKSPLSCEKNSSSRESSRIMSPREENIWKPNKKEGGGLWMKKEEKSWRLANRHSRLMKNDRIGS